MVRWNLAFIIILVNDFLVMLDFIRVILRFYSVNLVKAKQREVLRITKTTESFALDRTAYRGQIFLKKILG
jgi:hypothetical protein